MKEKKSSLKRTKKFLRVGGSGQQSYGTTGGKAQRRTAQIQSAFSNRFGAHPQAVINGVGRYKGQRRALAQKRMLAASYAMGGPAGYSATYPGLLGPAPSETQTPPGAGVQGLIAQINKKPENLAQSSTREPFSSPGGSSVLDSLMNNEKE
jgi:hypothetical protein